MARDLVQLKSVHAHPQTSRLCHMFHDGGNAQCAAPPAAGGGRHGGVQPPEVACSDSCGTGKDPKTFHSPELRLSWLQENHM